MDASRTLPDRKAATDYALWNGTIPSFTAGHKVDVPSDYKPLESIMKRVLLSESK